MGCGTWPTRTGSILLRTVHSIGWTRTRRYPGLAIDAPTTMATTQRVPGDADSNSETTRFTPTVCESAVTATGLSSGEARTAVSLADPPVSPAMPPGDIAGLELLNEVAGGPAIGPLALLAGNPAEHPQIWYAYRAGLLAAYHSIGVAHLVPSADVPVSGATVVLALTHSRHVVGGVRMTNGTDIPDHQGLSFLAEPIAMRAAQGINEASGTWVAPIARSAGLAVALTRAIITLASRADNRYIVGLCNDANLHVVERAGFMRDPRFVRFPWPGEDVRSTLVWFDFCADGPLECHG